MNRRNHFGILVIAALAFGTAMPLAHADDVDDCNGDLPAFVVKGCSAIIADSNTSEDNLEAAYVARGRAYDQFEKWDEALADLTNATELNPRDANAWSNRGAVNEHRSDPEMAVKDYDKSISLDPKNAGTYFNRGNANFSLENYDDALKDYQAAIKRDPKHVDAIMGRGFTYVKLGKKDKAKADFKKVIAMTVDEVVEADAEAALEQLKGK